MATALVLLLLLPACEAGSPPAPDPSSAPATKTAPGEPATWTLATNENPQPSSTTVAVLVSRLACNNGVTGQVLAPEVQPGRTEIVVTFTVEPKEPGGAECQGNDQVPWQLDLGEPLQGRALIDGQCRKGRPAAQICQDTATRFKP